MSADIEHAPPIKLLFATAACVAIGTGIAHVVGSFKKEAPEEPDDDAEEAEAEAEKEAVQPAPAWKKTIFAVIIVTTITISVLLILLHFRKQLFSEKVVEGRLFI